MKKLLVLFAMSALAAPALQAQELQAMDATLHAMTGLHSLDVINWKVGDEEDYNVSMSLGSGTEVQSVTQDTGTAVWMHSDVSLMGQAQTEDALINKADGKILELKQNGQDVAIPNDQITITSQEYTSITVAAGTFKCIHITATTTDQNASKMEEWANPQATVMDGALKTIITTSFGDMTLELTAFKHGT